MVWRGKKEAEVMVIDVGKVAGAAKRGLVNAQRTYESWSGWWWAPPEYVGTMAVARAVHRLESVVWVTLEHNVRDALREARGGLGRPATNLPKQGRFDIVVWGAKTPQGVIEVKTRGYSTLLGDVNRVCNAIGNAKEMRWGLVAYLYSWGDGEEKEGKDRVSDRLASIAESAEQLVVCDRGMHFTRHRGRPRVENGGAWTAEVLEIRR